MASIEAVTSVHVALYVEKLGREQAAPSVKRSLAAIRTLLDWLAAGGVLPFNPASAVRGPKHSARSGNLSVPDPAYAVVHRLLDSRRTWIKFSGACLNPATGPPAYADATEVARSFAMASLERMVWGSEWPHRGERHMPDDTTLFDLLAAWQPRPNGQRAS